MPAEVHRWTQLQPYGSCSGHHTVGDVDRVLHIGQQQSGLEDGLSHLVAPDGQAILEAELSEIVDRGHLQVVLGTLFAADLHHGAIRRSCSRKCLSMTMRPSGAGSAAISRP